MAMRAVAMRNWLRRSCSVRTWPSTRGDVSSATATTPRRPRRRSASVPPAPREPAECDEPDEGDDDPEPEIPDDGHDDPDDHDDPADADPADPAPASRRHAVPSMCSGVSPLAEGMPVRCRFSNRVAPSVGFDAGPSPGPRQVVGGAVEVGGGGFDVGGGAVEVPPPDDPPAPELPPPDPPPVLGDGVGIGGGATLNLDVHGWNWIGCVGTRGHGVGGKRFGSSRNAAAAKRPQMAAE